MINKFILNLYSRHTLLLHDAHWGNGPSQCQGEGEPGEGAGEHWPSWTHWLQWVQSQPWSSSSFLPFHLQKGRGKGSILRDGVIENQIVKENPLKTNIQVGQHCKLQQLLVTNVSSQETQLNPNMLVRLQIHLVLTYPWKIIHSFKHNISMGPCLSMLTQKSSRLPDEKRATID